MQAEAFDDFYQEVHGQRPFPWQLDLVRDVAVRGTWPSLVDAPTGLGKTSMLDIAVFISALDSDIEAARTIGRRRIFFVVDRRLVVDQAATHANKLAAALASAAPGSVAAEVASRLDRLRGVTAPSELLPVVKMRGGATWDAAWLARPDQLAIVTGTVDQVGSRLFFRGYGTSSRRWPIDAAMVGTDSLIMVDEAHLATALTTTLAQAHSYDQPPERSRVPRASVVQLTATATGGTYGGWTSAFDTAAHLNNTTARRRLTATKSLRLVECAKAAAVRVMSDAAEAALDGPLERVLVVCNTVDRARSVHAELAKRLPSGNVPLLLIGRSRQPDREAVVDLAIRAFAADRDTRQSGGLADLSNILVATQTVEVGVDLDATALVTECASWDALVQRLGRVNRRGLRDHADVTVVQDDDKQPPVYGETRTRTAEFLKSLLGDDPESALDVSPLALRNLQPPSDAQRLRPDVPLLLPAHLDAWVRTGPAPTNDAPLDPYLHGFDGGVAPVAIAWRDGLQDILGDPVGNSQATRTIDTVPVRAEECVEVPIAAVRRWLTAEKALPISDWDEDDDWDVPFASSSSTPAWRREALPDGTTAWRLVAASQIRPGDAIVVPSEVGGLDEYGWAPTSTTRVADVAELVALDRDQPILRLDRGLPERLGLEPPDDSFWDRLRDWASSDDVDQRASLAEACRVGIQKWLSSKPIKANGAWDAVGVGSQLTRRATLATLMDGADLYETTVAPTRDRAWEVTAQSTIVMRPPGGHTPWQEASEDSVDGTTHLGSGRPVKLREHGHEVGRRALEITTALGLDATISAVIADAARWHDLGKVDPRFQAMLFGGDRILASLASEPLAKSGMPPGDLQLHRDARRLSGLPSRARHEAWSQVIVSQYLEGRSTPYEGDTQLLLHLVASHHGHARPLLPPVEDTADHRLEAEVDGERVVSDLPRIVELNHAEEFSMLNQRYGRWGLALLESIVRCADMTVSGEGS